MAGLSREVETDVGRPREASQTQDSYTWWTVKTDVGLIWTIGTGGVSM